MEDIKFVEMLDQILASETNAASESSHETFALTRVARIAAILVDYKATAFEVSKRMSFAHAAEHGAVQELFIVLLHLLTASAWASDWMSTSISWLLENAFEPVQQARGMFAMVSERRGDCQPFCGINLWC